MKITFNNNQQYVTATHIIRCRVKDTNLIFHVAVHGDEVDVFSPGAEITCYEVDNNKLPEVPDGH